MEKIEFKIENKIFLVTGLLSFGVLILYLFAQFLSGFDSLGKLTLISVTLVLTTAYSFKAFRGVKRILIFENHIQFLPNGFLLEFQDIESITHKSIDGHPGHVIETLTLKMKSDREKWIPGYLLWIKKECSLKLIGEKSKQFNATFESKFKNYIENNKQL